MTQLLNKRCLIDLDEGEGYSVFSIHRTLQVVLRLDLDWQPLKRKEIFNHALSIVSRASPKTSRLQIPDPTQWPQFQRSDPHALTLCRAITESDAPLDPSLELANLLYHAGFHVWERWNPITRDGTLLLETAENILNKLH